MKRPIYAVLCACFLFSCSQTGREFQPQENGEVRIEDQYFVNEQSAERIARAFFDGAEPVLLGTDNSEALRSELGGTQLPSYYIYSGAGGGYVIVSANETAYPILGYSKEGRLELDNLPCGLKMMLGIYSRQINESRRTKLEPSAEIHSLRTALRAKGPVGEVVVAPLMPDIHWDQMPFYNDLCPSSQVPVGCVATATSQIMRHWEYPLQAKGRHSYTTTNFGVQSHDYNYTIDWDAMPKATLKEANYEVARFCYGVAVSVNMSFDYAFNGGSGAYQNAVPSALIRFYGYPKNVSCENRYQYEDDAWLAMLKNELDNGRPIQYGGAGTGGGHSFILDGYDSKNYFHVNWGWHGESDGWFMIDALDPDDLGTGGGTGGGFNQGQQAVINFAPPAVVVGDNDEAITDEPESKPVVSTTAPDVFVLNPSDVFIRYTSFNGVVTISNASGYAAYLNKKIEVAEGATIAYKVVPVQGDESISPCMVIAIDYNKDGTFDITKESIELPVLLKNKETFEGSFTIPESVKKGTYRMRVYVGDLLGNPNKSQNLGEFEDYHITVK